MWTLHGYAARELLKTFFMTSVALTVLLVMGGGVANLFRGEGAGAREMARIFLFLTPVAVTLILPVAALFSATITYGRMAADNEILACRAAGINIHRVLLSALVLGLFVTGFTYWSWNHLIPQLSGQIKNLSRKDLPAIVLGQFQKAKPLSFGKYRIMANQCEAVSPAQLPEEVRDAHTYLQLTGVSFIEVEDHEPTRYGTADKTIIDFDHAEGTPRVTVDLQGVHSFDASRRQYYQFKHQVLGPFEIPTPVKRKIKFENLATLRDYLDHPEHIPAVADRLIGLRREMMSHFMYLDVLASLDPDKGGDGKFLLKGDGFRFDISAGRFAEDPDDGRPLLREVKVVETGESGGRILTADSAIIEVKSGLDRTRPVILVELIGNVEIRRDPEGSGDRVVRKGRETLPPVEFMAQQRLQEQVLAFDETSLLDPGQKIPMHPKQGRLRQWLIDRVEHSISDVYGEVHFRASYSLSAIAVVLFGAVLGIIVRGGQVLTAFGISCIPMVIVVVASIVGRNLADRPEHTSLSIGVMWGATVFMFLATGFVAARFLKR
ncbi:MAG: LptF/LptG family permease [Phycisphaerae bacterium]|nr:LptF/LptG family permease [Phycisphaerae bacterium]